jgi:hypothetical protein
MAAVREWMAAYTQSDTSARIHNMTSPTPMGRAGRIRFAFHLETHSGNPRGLDSENFIHFQGIDGRLPNLDLLNTYAHTYTHSHHAKSPTSLYFHLNSPNMTSLFLILFSVFYHQSIQRIASTERMVFRIPDISDLTREYDGYPLTSSPLFRTIDSLLMALRYSESFLRFPLSLSSQVLLQNSVLRSLPLS